MTRFGAERTALLVGAAIVATSVTLLAVRARAAGIPDADVLTYTGYLEDADGQPLQSTVSIAVELWSDGEAGAGDKVCEAVAESVELQAGRFQVPLTDCDAEVKKNRNLWTEVRVDGASLGRTKLGAVPYAIEAAHATSADEAGGALDERIAALETQLTAWANMTPAPTLADSAATTITPSSLSGKFRRVGDSAELIVKTVFSAPTSAASGSFVWTLPTALSVDASKLDTGYATVGWALVNQNGARETCSVNSSGGRTVAIDCSGGTLKSAVANAVVTIHVSAPIAGWKTP